MARLRPVKQKEKTKLTDRMLLAVWGCRRGLLQQIKNTLFSRYLCLPSRRNRCPPPTARRWGHRGAKKNGGGKEDPPPWRDSLELGWKGGGIDFI